MGNFYCTFHSMIVLGFVADVLIVVKDQEWTLDAIYHALTIFFIVGWIRRFLFLGKFVRLFSILGRGVGGGELNTEYFLLKIHAIKIAIGTNEIGAGGGKLLVPPNYH